MGHRAFSHLSSRISIFVRFSHQNTERGGYRKPCKSADPALVGSSWPWNKPELDWVVQPLRNLVRPRGRAPEALPSAVRRTISRAIHSVGIQFLSLRFMSRLNSSQCSCMFPIADAIPDEYTSWEPNDATMPFSALSETIGGPSTMSIPRGRHDPAATAPRACGSPNRGT